MSSTASVARREVDLDAGVKTREKRSVNERRDGRWGGNASVGQKTQPVQPGPLPPYLQASAMDTREGWEARGYYEGGVTLSGSCDPAGTEPPVFESYLQQPEQS